MRLGVHEIGSCFAMAIRLCVISEDRMSSCVGSKNASMLVNPTIRAGSVDLNLRL